MTSLFYKKKAAQQKKLKKEKAKRREQKKKIMGNAVLSWFGGRDAKEKCAIVEREVEKEEIDIGMEEEEDFDA